MLFLYGSYNFLSSTKPPTVAGALYDTMGNYDAGFYFAGVMIFLSGAMLFFIPMLQRRINNKPKFRNVNLDTAIGRSASELIMIGVEFYRKFNTTVQ